MLEMYNLLVTYEWMGVQIFLHMAKHPWIRNAGSQALVKGSREFYYLSFSKAPVLFLQPIRLDGFWPMQSIT